MSYYDNNSDDNDYFDSSDFQDTKIIRWIICALFVIFALINGFELSSLLLVLAALLVMPIRAVDFILSKLKPTTAIIIAVSIILVAVVVTPDLFSVKNNGTSILGNNPSGSNQSISGSGNGNSGNESSGNESGGSIDDNDQLKDAGEDNTDDDGSMSDTKVEMTYVLNVKTMKFHLPDCYSAETMDEKNKEVYVGFREDLINQGYVACKNCKP